MFNLLTPLSHRREVIPYVSFAAVIAILALVLSMVSIVPTTARADEASFETSAETVPTTDSEATEISTATEENPEGIAELNDALTELDQFSIGETYNSDIKVDVTDISSDEAEDSLSNGDTLVISGTWDALAAEKEEGAAFWVAFPSELSVDALTAGYEDLVGDDSNDVIGFIFDTSDEGLTGDWEVEAVYGGGDQTETLNFRTSTDPEEDIAIDLPNADGIRAGPTASVLAPLSINGPVTNAEGITVDISSIENSINPGEQLELGDSALVQGVWSAGEDFVSAPSSFKITLPEVFAASPVSDIPIVDAELGEIGSCVLAEDLFECTIDEGIEGPIDGEWKFNLQAEQRTTEEAVSFEFEGGGPIEVPLPGGGGIGPELNFPADPAKSGSIGSDLRTITWTVTLPGALLIEAGVAVPGVFTDSPDEGHRVRANSGTIRYYDSVDNNGKPIMQDLDGASIVLGKQAGVDNSFEITATPGAETWDPSRVYRITYQTFSDTLIAPNTQVKNSFDYGAEGVVIGGVSPQSPSWKTGTWGTQFGADAYQSMRWTILVPGTAVENGEIVIEDQLKGAHEVTADTPGSLVVNVENAGSSTAELGTSVLTYSDNKNLTITIPVENHVAGDVFRVQYTTYYEGTATHPKGTVPENGVPFSNSATVGGQTVSSTIRTQGFVNSKNGNINNAPKELNGETHPAYSTLDWNLTVSGNQVGSFEGTAPISITDTLGENHQICKAHGSSSTELIDRLGAQLTVRDRTASNANVPLEDAGIKFSLAEGSEPNSIVYTLTPTAGFKRNYNYIITYTTCTTSGGMDAFGTEYGNTAQGTGINVGRTLTLSAGGGATGNSVPRGSFSLNKVAASDSTFPRDTEFGVRVEEFAPSRLDENGHPRPDAQPNSSYVVKVSADGNIVSGNATRGNGWKVRLTEVELPEDGRIWAPGVFHAAAGVELLDEGRTALVSITPRSNVELTLENSGAWASASIVKEINGEVDRPNPYPQSFQVTALIDVDADGVIDRSEDFGLSEGIPKEISDLPLGARITFEEKQPENTDDFTWGEPSFDKNPLVVGADLEANRVTLTNTVSQTEGTFNLHKVVEGTDSANIPDQFTVTATWDGGSEELTLPADGTPVALGQNLPTGTQVTLVEQLPANSDNLQWAQPSFSGTGVEIVDGNAVVVVGRGNADITITNTAVEFGTLQLAKTISGEAGEAVPADAEFQVLAQWRVDGNATDFEERILTLTPNEPTNLGEFLPTGTEIRLSEIAVADVPGVEWGAVTWSGDGSWFSTEGTSATAIISDDPAVGRVVTLNNEATYADRPVTLTKTVEGEAEDRVADDYEFTVTAFFPETNETRSYTVTRDEEITIGSFPVGTQIVFAEDQPIDSDQVTWGVPEFSTQTLTVGVAEDANFVTLTNQAEPSVGTFNIHKVIEGTEADNPNLPDSYTILASWEGGEQEFILPANGDVQSLDLDLETGTEVTLTEVIPTDVPNLEFAAPAFTGEGVSIDADGNAIVTIGRGDAALTITNTVVELGTLQLIKTITGEADNFVSINDEFTVRAEWRSEDGEEFQSKNLIVQANGQPVSLDEDLPVGTEVRFTEIGTPAIDGVEWGSVTWSGGDWLRVENATAVGVISDDPAEGRTITLQNEANYADRPVNVEKLIEGAAAGLVTDTSFIITATFPETGEVRNYTLQAGEDARSIGNFPVGTIIEFAEVQPEDTDQVTWGEPVFEPGQRIEVGADDLEVNVTVTNIANDTYGTFSVAKAITGPEASHENVPDTFQVRANWNTEAGPQEKILTVPLNGSVEFGEELINGTQVILTEILPADGNGIAWGNPIFSGPVTTDGTSAVVTIAKDPKDITVTNYADTNSGTLRLTKGVSGEAAEAVGADVEFTVEATWNDGSEFQTRTLTLTQGETVDLGEELEVGTEVTFTEINLPENIAGIEWGTINWGTNPEGAQWLRQNTDGSVTGIISDDPTAGRLITLNNEALWTPGSVKFEKFIFDGETPVPASEAELPEGAEFEIQIDSIQLPEGKDLPADAGIAEGEIIILNAANNFSYESAKVLPKGTVVVFNELDPAALPGMDWGLPFYHVAADAGEAGDRNTLEISADGEARVEIRNRPIPTSDVDIDKVVTGPKGNQVENDDSALFQVTASWIDIDGFTRECVLDVVPGQSAIPVAACEALVIDGKVQFPTNTEITFTETAARTDVSNVKWTEVNWSVNSGDADIDPIEGEPTAATIVIGDGPVNLGLENKTSSNGMIIIPIPLPTPPGGGSSTPPEPSSPIEPDQPDQPEHPRDPVDPAEPAQPGKPGSPESAAPSPQAQAQKPSAPGLAATGANVLWIVGGALILLAGGAWLTIRGRRNSES